MRAYPFLLAASLFASEQCTETLYSSWGQSFEVHSIVYKEKSDWWDIMIFENPIFGRVLVMDGTVQLTEKDERIYHEMMAHVPLLTHDNPKSVLIIGGGDGGVLREVLRHQTVERVVLVEIDERVIDLSKKYLPFLAKGAFVDPRTTIVIQDGCKYVKETTERFDVILSDTTDPIGAGAALFTEEFYGDCKAILNEGGILINQNGVPFLQPEELALTLKIDFPILSISRTTLHPFQLIQVDRWHSAGQAINAIILPLKSSLKDSAV
jgi:spermidine synthase